MKKSILAIALMLAVPSAYASCFESTKTRAEVKAELTEHIKLYPNWMSDIDYPANVRPVPVSTKTREQVKAELVEHIKLYPNWMSDIDYPANIMPKPVSTKTRAEVKAELAEFLANGGVIPIGDNYYPMPCRR